MESQSTPGGAAGVLVEGTSACPRGRARQRFGQHRPNERLVDALEQVRYRLAQGTAYKRPWMNAVSSHSAVGSKEIGSLGGNDVGYMYMCTMRSSLGTRQPTTRRCRA